MKQPINDLKIVNKDEEQPAQMEIPPRQAIADLPTVIQRRVLSNFGLAGILFLVVIFLTIYYHEIRYVVGVVIPMFLIYLGLSTKADYFNGKIAEIAVRCTNISEMTLQKKLKVVFSTDEETPHFYEFVLTKAQGQDIYVNGVYIIYFNIEKPQLLLGHTHV